MDKTNTTVYISNLSYQRDRNGLKSMFSKFGRITNIKIIVEPVSNQSRGMAFVEMATHSAAVQAIEALNQQVVDGRTVKATWATPLKATSVSKAPAAKNKNRDLEFKEIQLAKKARNEAKRNRRPF